MKKLMFMLLALLGAAFTFTSCGDGGEEGLTEEEIQARVDSIYQAESVILREESIRSCTNKLAVMADEKRDSLLAVWEEAGEPTPVEIIDESESGEGDVEDVGLDNDAGLEGNEANVENTEELTDEQVIEERVDERLANLRAELRQECYERVMRMAEHRADSVWAATHKTYTPQARTQPDVVEEEEEVKDGVNNRPGATRKGEEKDVTDRPGATKGSEKRDVTDRPGATRKDDDNN